MIGTDEMGSTLVDASSEREATGVKIRICKRGSILVDASLSKRQKSGYAEIGIHRRGSIC
jgi:hypothetical protein